MFRNILIPTDGSELSKKAIQNGVELAKTLGAKVTGLHVILDAPVAAGIGKRFYNENTAKEAAETFLEEIAGEARRQGVVHECFYIKGSSADDEIIKAATSRGCDLICMASHGRSGLISGLFGGSETMHVLTHSTIPVLVYR